MSSYKILSDNQTYDINTLSSGSVTLPYYGGYKDKSNNVSGNISKSTPHDISIYYVSGSGWLTSSISIKDDTASSITLNYTSATGERSARIYLKGAGLTTSNYITITQKKQTEILFYWKFTYTIPYNNPIWAHISIHSVLDGQLADPAIVATELSSFFIPANPGSTYSFTFYLKDDGKYYCEKSTINLLANITYNGKDASFSNITNLIKENNKNAQVELSNFFNTINNYYLLYFESSSSTFVTSANKPYGTFTVTADDVLSGKYTSDNPYII